MCRLLLPTAHPTMPPRPQKRSPIAARKNNVSTLFQPLPPRHALFASAFALRWLARLPVRPRHATVLLAWILTQSALPITATGAENEPSRPNVLLICIDDLRPELGCYGKQYIHSPNIDRLARQGRRFTHHYVQAPTCGASRYAMLTGRYGPSGNGALIQRGKKLGTHPEAAPPSLPHYFRQHGYKTVSVGKVSHYPGGHGGSDWDDEDQPEMPLSWDAALCPTGPWKHPRGIMHGLARGNIREQPSTMDVFESETGPDTIYPDGIIVAEALRQLQQLGQSDQPFFLAVGIIRPHLPFGAPSRYMRHYENAELPPIPHPTRPDKAAGPTTWHASGEFMKYHRWGRDPNTDEEFATRVRKHYAACVSFADAQVGKLIDALQSIGKSDNTIVLIWGDHGWHLGEHAVWGKHTLFEESLHSPLVIRTPTMARPGEPADGVVETIDIMPTLCELASLPAPDFVDGTSLVPMLNDPESPGHPAVSYAAATTLRTSRYRLISHKNGHLELYDFSISPPGAVNVAQRSPEIAAELKQELSARLSRESR